MASVLNAIIVGTNSLLKFPNQRIIFFAVILIEDELQPGLNINKLLSTAIPTDEV